MKRTVSAMEARRRFGELLESVFYKNDDVIIERNGKPMGAIVSPTQYRILEQNRELLREAMEAVWRESPGSISEEEAMKLGLEAQAWARGKVREDKKKTRKSA